MTRLALTQISRRAAACRPTELAATAAAASLAAEPDADESIQCAQGCSWCCRQVPVAVSVAEVARLVRYLREKLTPDAYEALRERCVELAASRRAMSRRQWEEARTPCPLLVDDSCSAYPVRPLPCRGYNSRDAAACERFYHVGRGAVPASLPQFMRSRDVQTAILEGLWKRRRLPMLELVAALAVGMALPIERYLDPEAWVVAEFKLAVPAVLSERSFFGPEMQTA